MAITFSRNSFRDLATAVAPLLAGLQLFAWISFLPIAWRGGADFRQLYTAGYMVRTGRGRQLYDFSSEKKFQDELVSPAAIPLPFTRPSYEALLFVPLSMLPYRQAYLAFLFINVGFLAITARMLRPRLPAIGSISKWVTPFALALFFPVEVALMQGQDSILLLAMFTAAFVYVSDDKPFQAGLVTGAAVFKPQLALPVIALFVLWRRWKFCLGAAVAIAAATILSISIAGAEWSKGFLRTLLSIGAGVSSPAEKIRFTFSPAFMGNLRGLMLGVSGWDPFSRISVALVIVTSVILLIWIWRSASVRMPSSEAFTIAVTAAVFLSYYMFPHDMSVLLLPILVSINTCLLSPKNAKYGSSVAISAVASLLLPAFLGLSPQHFYMAAAPLLVFLVTSVGRARSAVQAASSSTGVLRSCERAM